MTTIVTSVALEKKEMSWLKDAVTLMAKHNWRGAAQAKIIRSLIKAAMEKDLDLREISGEEELTNLFISNL